MKRLLAGFAALAVVVAGAIGVQRSVAGTERPSEGKQPILRSGYDGQPKVNSDLGSETGLNGEGNNHGVDRKTFEKQAEERGRQQQKVLAEMLKQTREQAAAEMGPG